MQLAKPQQYFFTGTIPMGTSRSIGPCFNVDGPQAPEMPTPVTRAPGVSENTYTVPFITSTGKSTLIVGGIGATIGYFVKKAGNKGALIGGIIGGVIGYSLAIAFGGWDSAPSKNLFNFGNRTVQLKTRAK